MRTVEIQNSSADTSTPTTSSQDVARAPGALKPVCRSGVGDGMTTSWSVVERGVRAGPEVLDDRGRRERAGKGVGGEHDADELVAGVVGPRAPHAARPAVGADGGREAGAANLYTDAEAPALRAVGQRPGRAACDIDLVGGHGV